MITSGGTTTLGLYDFKIGIEQFGQTGYWVQKANGYPINKRIMLANGDIVKSTIDGNTNDPNSDMTGWVKVDAASQIFDESGRNQQEVNNGLSSISSLLAISTKTNGNRQYVAEGRQKGWFKYNATRATENDGGTIFNGWERIDFQHIDFDMFNVPSVGGDAQIRAAFNASKNLKKPLINRTGTYILTGTSDIEIGHDYDLSGTVFKLASTFTGAFVITRNAETIVHEVSSSIVTLIKSQGIVSGSATSLPVLLNNDVLDDSFIEVNSSQEMYRYRGNVVERYELNRVFNKGQLASTFFYDFDLSTVTSVTQQRVQDSKFFGSGLTIDETERNYGGFYVFVRDGNNFDLKNFRFINKSFTSRLNTYNRIHVNANAHAVKIDGVDTSATYINSNGESNYTFSATKCFDLTVSNACADGYGWGAVGMNSCKRVTLNNSQLSRVDFHNPCHDFLILNDCLIGDWGVLATMRGDLILNNPRFVMRKATNSNGFIRSRGDTGGWCNGNLIINNMSIEGELAVKTILLECQSNGVGNNEIPLGSPVRAEFFTNIEINGVKQKADLLSYFIDAPKQNTSRTLMPPKSITVNDFISGVNTFESIFRIGYFKKRDEGVQVNLNNTEFYRLMFVDPLAVGTEVNIEMNNVRGVNGSGVSLYNTANGTINAVGGVLNNYTEYANGVWNMFNPLVKFSNGRVKVISGASYFSTESGVKDHIYLNNMNINVNNLSSLRITGSYYMKDCLINGVKGFLLSNSTSGTNVQASGIAKIRSKVGTNYFETLVDLSISGSYAVSSGSIAITVSAGIAIIVLTDIALANIIEIS